MSDMTVRARSLPYREPRPGTYTCERCGIEREKNHHATRSNYCRDCLPEVRELGWLPRTNHERKAA